MTTRQLASTAGLSARPVPGFTVTRLPTADAHVNDVFTSEMARLSQ